MSGLADRLVDLERVWPTQQVPILEYLQPGLSEEAMDATTAPLNITLSGEARLWWGWHDGVPAEFGRPARRITTLHEYIPPAEAVRLYQEFQEIARRDQSGPDWEPARLPIATTVSREIVACEVTGQDTCPIWAVSWGDYDDVLAAPSIEAMVDIWLQGFDRGVWSYSATEARWDENWDAVPPELGMNRLIG